MKKKWGMGLFIGVILAALMLSACSNKTNTDSTKEKEFRYAMSGLYKPFNFKENGKLQGFDVEIGQALAKKMGMKAVPVTNPWETIIQGLQSKKYDAIIGSMTVTDERKKSVDFTETYYRSGAQIFVRKDNRNIQAPSDLKGKKIGVVKASTYKELALTYTDKKNVVEYDSDITALMDLPTGRLDAVITDQMVGFPIIKAGAIKIQDVGEPLTHDDQAIAVRKEDKELKEKINKALQEIIKDGTYKKISDKWFGRSILGE
ncbi:ABC transporter substrate-binding protein [Neobacillus niacini]|uniref:ABC transporter substrate-binding protein n=1 Tax=Neobacillus niacini TaxID=86668 RepID=UPI002858A18F|nr:ABC transporter substrate-binding protein [Neobacillus niacini]MDR7001653.1 polar amino acid transport system substrate-binding protein [Neobacillus niacini]